MMGNKGPAKYLYRVIDERASGRRLPLLSVSIHHGVVPRSTITDDEPRAEDLSNYKICRPGDIVLNRMRAFQGAVGISCHEGLVSPDYLVLRPRAEVYAPYLHHLFRSTWFVGEMVSRLRGIGSVNLGTVRTPRINAEDLGDVALDLPSLAEQRRIADFLDSEVSKCEAVERRRKKTAALLLERRTATVDRFLYGDDATGAIPLKYVASIVDTEHKTAPVVPGGGYWVVGTSAVRSGKIVDGRLYETDADSYKEWTRRCVPRPGDVFLSREAPVGEVGFYGDVSQALAIGQRMVLVRVNGEKMHPRFLLWNFMSTQVREFISLATQGSIHPHLNMGDIGNIPVPSFSLSRQLEVLSNLEEHLVKIDAAMKVCDQMVSRLEERKRALVTAAVTGQMDVTTVQGFAG